MISLLLALLAQQSPPIKTGPPVAISGRVVRVVGGDTIITPHAQVLLHRVSTNLKGPIDSTTAGADGTFNFRLRPDSGSIYLVSARWTGVEYFGQPFTSTLLTIDRNSQILVADTSSNTPIKVNARQLVMVAPVADGTREVVDVLTITNTSGKTRVASGSPRASWRLTLPPKAVGAHLDDSDFSPDAFQQIGDTIMLLAPIPPGEHLVGISYQIAPATRRFVIPSTDPLDSMSLMVGEGKLKLSGAFRLVSDTSIEGKSFSHWEGKLPENDSLIVSLPGDGTVPKWVLPALVVLLGCGLLGAGWYAYQRQRLPVIAHTSEASATNAILDQIVALDAANADGEEVVGKDRWDAYLEERRQLKEKLRAEVSHS